MQSKTAGIVKGAITGIAVGTAVMLVQNSKMNAGASLKKNVKTMAKSVSKIADSVKTLMG